MAASRGSQPSTLGSTYSSATEPVRDQSVEAQGVEDRPSPASLTSCLLPAGAGRSRPASRTVSSRAGRSRADRLVPRGSAGPSRCGSDPRSDRLHSVQFPRKCRPARLVQVLLGVGSVSVRVGVEEVGVLPPQCVNAGLGVAAPLVRGRCRWRLALWRPVARRRRHVRRAVQAGLARPPAGL